MERNLKIIICQGETSSETISVRNSKNASAIKELTPHDIWQFSQNCTSLSTTAISKKFQISRVNL